MEQGIEFANKINFKNFLISHHSPLREVKEIKIIQDNIINKKINFFYTFKTWQFCQVFL